MQKIVLDLSLIIDHFRKGSQIFDDLVRKSVENTVKVYLPGIVYTEISAGEDSKESHKLKKIEELPSIFEFTPENQIISQKAGFLVRDYPHLGIADAIVAATALSLSAKLATRNTKDFRAIKQLKFYKAR